MVALPLGGTRRTEPVRERIDVDPAVPSMRWSFIRYASSRARRSACRAASAPKLVEVLAWAPFALATAGSTFTPIANDDYWAASTRTCSPCDRRRRSQN